MYIEIYVIKFILIILYNYVHAMHGHAKHNNTDN